MTRKDYVLIAEAIAAGKTRPGKDSVTNIAEAIADRLARDNLRFDRARFLKAAGVQS